MQGFYDEARDELVKIEQYARHEREKDQDGWRERKDVWDHASRQFLLNSMHRYHHSDGPNFVVLAEKSIDLTPVFEANEHSKMKTYEFVFRTRRIGHQKVVCVVTSGGMFIENIYFHG